MSGYIKKEQLHEEVVEILNNIHEKQDISEKGQSNGYAGLDNTAKIPASQLPDSILGQVEYISTWNATTNMPTLPNASTAKGHYYVVDTGGTYNSIDFKVGDWVICNGVEWQKVDNTDAVPTVFGRIGNIVASSGDYAAEQISLNSTNFGSNNVKGGMDELFQSVSRSASVVVAASNSSPKSKLSADYVCTGTSDEVTIQSALDSITSGKVLLLEGTYNTGLNGVRLDSSKTLEGMGDSTVLQAAASGNRVVYCNASASYMTLCNLYVKGLNGQVIGVKLDSADRVTIRNVRAEGFYNIGISAYNSTNCIITGCFVRSIGGYDGTTRAYEPTGIVASSYAIINTNQVSNIFNQQFAGSGIYLMGLSSIVSGNIVQGVNDAGFGQDCIGIRVTGTSHAVTSNSISNHGTIGIDISGGAGTFSNNIQMNIIRKGTKSPSAAIRIGTGTSFNLVTNNDLSNGGATAVNDLGTGTIITAGNRS
ncbi:right-handed parallel beta-helix repeat-containing protein [Paenibacillus sp. FSL H8-0034]|uniref:right-handed parallel beta-helix repeat-containing protein n=1 Tax=Paenibacillus sp. FSL H8-0034 TaxID=2954671 RepID=UPI0030F67275